MSSPYQALILDHYRHPRGQREVLDADLRAEVSNPVCGDRLRLGFRSAEDGCIQDLHYHAKACAVATASASLMWEALSEMHDPHQLQEVAATVVAFLNNETDEMPDELASLRPLEDLRAFPMRLNCARLPWRGMLQGLSATS